MARANDYLYFHRKKSNARRFFNYPHRRKEKKGCHVQKMFWRETPFLCCCFFRDRIDHTLTITYTRNSIVNWNIHNSVSRNRIENENKLFSVRFFSFPLLCSIVYLSKHMHKHVYIVPYCCCIRLKKNAEKG